MATPARARKGCPARPAPSPPLRVSPPMMRRRIGRGGQRRRRQERGSARARCRAPRGPARARAGRCSDDGPSMAGRQQAHRLRQLERGQDRAGGHRPRSATAAPSSPIRGAPATKACSTAETWWMRWRRGVVGGVPGGTRSGASAAVPTDSRTMTVRPSSRRLASTATKAVRSSRPKGTAMTSSSSVRQRRARGVRGQLEPATPVDERAVQVVRELLVAGDPAMDPDVRLPGGGGGGDLVHGHLRCAGQEPGDPEAGPDAAEQEARQAGRRRRPGRRARGEITAGW